MSSLGTFCPFIPPYLIQELGRSGAMERTAVEATLRMDQELRSRRGLPDAPAPGGDPGTGTTGAAGAPPSGAAGG